MLFQKPLIISDSIRYGWENAISWGGDDSVIYYEYQPIREAPDYLLEPYEEYAIEYDETYSPDSCLVSFCYDDYDGYSNIRIDLDFLGVNKAFLVYWRVGSFLSNETTEDLIFIAVFDRLKESLCRLFY